MFSLQSQPPAPVPLSAPGTSSHGRGRCWESCSLCCSASSVLWLPASWRSCSINLCVSALTPSTRTWWLLCRTTKPCRTCYSTTQSSDCPGWALALSASPSTIYAARIPMELCSDETALNQSALVCWSTPQSRAIVQTILVVHVSQLACNSHYLCTLT